MLFTRSAKQKGVIKSQANENQYTEYVVPVRANDSCNGHKIHVGHRPIVFIRFNPDTYIEKGVILLHLFSQNKLGYLVIKNFKQEEWKHCLSTLCDTIQYWINHDHVTDKTVEVVHLFFSINH